MTIMTTDSVLELSVEQLIGALNKKLFMECARVQSELPPTSRASVDTLTAEVRFSELQMNPQVLTKRFTDRCSGGTSQSHSSRSNFLEEFPTTCQPSPSRGDRTVRRLRLPFRSTTDRLLDPCLPLLAQSHHFQSQKLDIDKHQVAAISPFVYRTRRGSPSYRQHHGIGHQGRRDPPEGVASPRL